LSEFFDIVDEADSIVGTASRDECHRARLIHRSVYIVLVNSRGELLIQRRSMSKDLYPGFFTGSATGHVDHGETYDEAAKRELLEELGVEAPLEKVCKFKSFSDVEREVSTLYVCRYEGEVQPDPREVTETRFVPVEEIAGDLAYGRRPYAPGFKVAFQEYVRHLKRKAAPRSLP